jgi:hypothetical protein
LTASNPVISIVDVSKRHLNTRYCREIAAKDAGQAARIAAEAKKFKEARR